MELTMWVSSRQFGSFDFSQSWSTWPLMLETSCYVHRQECATADKLSSVLVRGRYFSGRRSFLLYIYTQTFNKNGLLSQVPNDWFYRIASQCTERRVPKLRRSDLNKRRCICHSSFCIHLNVSQEELDPYEWWGWRFERLDRNQFCNSAPSIFWLVLLTGAQGKV